MLDTFLKSKEISDQLFIKLDNDPKGFRIVTGERPTGNLHLGHYFGALVNRIKLQKKNVEMFILVADQQVLTDHDSFDKISYLTKQLVIDNIAAGVDLENDNTFIFPHSQIPELNQLLVPFLTLVTMSELDRNPTVKEEIKSAGIKNINAGMFVYPVHQACDILSIKSNIVPVGKDQLPHIELSRVIAKRFNNKFCKEGGEIFPEPNALLSEAPSLVGLDGKQKMSKSRNNSIMLSATKDEIVELVKKATTDSEKFITYDPDNRPEVSNLIKLISLMSNKEPEEIAKEIGNGGANMLKEKLIDITDKFLEPMRERRKAVENDKTYINNILKKGIERTRYEASKTLAQVLKTMNMYTIL